MSNAIIKEASTDDTVKVNAAIVELDDQYDKSYFKNRYRNRDKLIFVKRYFFA